MAASGTAHLPPRRERALASTLLRWPAWFAALSVVAALVASAASTTLATPGLGPAPSAGVLAVWAAAAAAAFALATAVYPRSPGVGVATLAARLAATDASFILRLAGWLAAYVAVGALALCVPLAMEGIVPGPQRFINEREIGGALAGQIAIAAAAVPAAAAALALGALVHPSARGAPFWSTAERLVWRDLASFAITPAAFAAAVLILTGLVTRHAFTFNGLNAVLVGALIFFPAVRLKDLGARRSAPTADDLMARDPRPPVLYLRAFRDDARMGRRGVPAYVRAFSPKRPLTEEEQLAEALRPIGPVIAIADPKTPVQNLGAARNLFDDADWQEAVRAYMRAAALVVIRVSATEFVRWEMREAWRIAPPQRIWLLISNAGAADEFATRFAEIAGEAPPPPPAVPLMPDQSLNLVVSFSAEGRATYTRIEPVPLLRRDAASPMLGPLRAAFHRIEASVSPPGLDPLAVAAALLFTLGPLYLAFSVLFS